MIDIKDSNTIRLIQGESLVADFSTEEEYVSLTFVCRDLGLEIALIPANAAASGDDSSSGEEPEVEEYGWYLRYLDTNDVRPGIFTYDVVGIDNDDYITTIIYNAKLVVMPKNGERFYNPYYEYPHNTKREH